MSAGQLAFPFTNKTALAVAILASLLGDIPWIGTLAFFGLPPSMFMPIVRGHAAGRGQPMLDPPGGRARLLTDWWKSLIVTAVVFFPLPLMYLSHALQSDVPALDTVNHLVLQVSVFLLPILAGVYTWHLGALGVTDDVMRAILPGAAVRVREERMDMGLVGMAVCFFILGGFLVAVVGGLLMKLTSTLGSILARLLWVWLVFQVAILVGESIRKGPGARRRASLVSADDAGAGD